MIFTQYSILTHPVAKSGTCPPPWGFAADVAPMLSAPTTLDHINIAESNVFTSVPIAPPADVQAPCRSGHPRSKPLYPRWNEYLRWGVVLYLLPPKITWT